MFLERISFTITEAKGYLIYWIKRKVFRLVNMFSSVYIYYVNINQSSEFFLFSQFRLLFLLLRKSGFCFYLCCKSGFCFYAYVNQERHIFVIPFHVSLHYYDQINRYVFTLVTCGNPPFI